VITAAAAGNHDFLRSLAYGSGGNTLDLTGNGNRQIGDIIGTSPYVFISATARKNTVTQLYPQYSQPADKPLTVTGRLLKKNAVVMLNYGINGKILERVPYKISRKKAAESNILRTFWAQEKIRCLMKSPNRNKDVTDTGKKYGLVTPGTSLIVLESLQQYIQYRIKPPESLPKMRDAYESRITKQKNREKEKFEAIVRQWGKRVHWWKRDFQAPKTEYKKKRKKNIPRERPNPNISGAVVLADGSVIPGVLIELTGTGISKLTTVSNEQGTFRFRGLLVGTYQLRAELDGFKTVINKNISVVPGTNTHINIMMETSTIKQEVVVTGQATVIDTR
ncbi:MAG: carboxypeptidase regulatory-like domain-containing protein, partial [bacterium]|nr:carboxypeptidase regulatory-like domain-containing protein [bacterium]